MPVPPTDCSPATVLADTHCLDCLSQTQLKGVLFLLWANLAGFILPDDLETILKSSQCNNCGIGETRRLVMEVEAMANAASNNMSIGQIQDALKCLPCMSLGQLDAGISTLKCKYWSTVTPV